MADTDNLSELEKFIDSHAEYFNSKLELIPPSVYFPKQTDEDEPFHEKLNRNKRRKRTALEVEERRKVAWEARKRKYDPSQYKSVVDILAEKGKKNGEDEQEISQESDDDEDAEGRQKPTTVSEMALPGFVGEGDREELKRKLREKINALRAKRKAPPLNFDGTDPVEKESRPNKRRKIDEKSKIKRERENAQNYKVILTPKSEKIIKAEIKGEFVKEEKVKIETMNGTSSFPAALEFAAFDFSSGKPVPTHVQTNKRKPSKHALLKKAKEKKEKIESLKGTEEGQKLIENQSWEKIMKKASGEKIMDDVTKLQKSIKRDQSKKKKSQQQWKQRLADQSKRQEAAIKKRESNIELAKQKRKDRKSGKKIK